MSCTLPARCRRIIGREAGPTLRGHGAPAEEEAAEALGTVLGPLPEVDRADAQMRVRLRREETREREMNAVHIDAMLTAGGLVSIGWLVLWMWSERSLRRIKRKARISRSQDRTRTWLRTNPFPAPRAKGIMIPASAGKLAREGVDWLERMEEFLDSDEAWEHVTTIAVGADYPPGSWMVVDKNSSGDLWRLMPIKPAWNAADELAFLQGVKNEQGSR